MGLFFSLILAMAIETGLADDIFQISHMVVCGVRVMNGMHSIERNFEMIG